MIQSHKTNECGFVNLTNNGYRCYINTIIQSLTSIKELNDYFIMNAERYFNDQYQ